MFLSFLLSLALIALPQTPTQAPLTFPPPTATTAAGCAAEVKAFVDKQNAAAGITGAPLTAADRDKIVQSQRINTAKLAMTKACAARVDPKTVADADLTAALQLFADANQLEPAQQMLTRALARKSTGAERAALLALAIPIERRLAPPTTDRVWRVANLYPTMEQLGDELEANPAATFEQKWAMHTYFESLYRGDDIDAGIIKHGQWIIAQGDACAPQDRAKLGRQVVSAHVNMAEAYAGQNMNDKALQLLGDASKKWGDIAGTADTVSTTLARYKLVGTKGAAISAPTWFNGPASKSLDVAAGKVTLLEFTAHWCGPCRESYPGVNRLRAKYAPKGFQVVLATRLWGYFSSERNLPAEAELARDKTYFAEHELSDVPVAIGPLVTAKVVNGKVVYEPHQDPNDVAYGVGGIPQIQLIDKHGVIRLIMVGYDNANEAKLAKVIEALLAEK